MTIKAAITRAGQLLANAGDGSAGDLYRWDEDLYRQPDGALVLVYSAGGALHCPAPKTLTRDEAIEWLTSRAKKISGYNYTREEAEQLIR